VQALLCSFKGRRWDGGVGVGSLWRPTRESPGTAPGTWFTAGMTTADAMRWVSCSAVKLDTPSALALPSAANASIA